MALKVTFRTPLCRHNIKAVLKVFANDDQSGLQRFLHITSCKYLGTYLKYFKAHTHVQTACESPDLNMASR